MRILKNRMDTISKFRAALAGVDNAEPIVEEFAAIAMQEIPQWKLIACTWTNYYSYERGHIDFTPAGLRGVIAPNCAGKTTIIDIISIALFNSPRGKRQDAIRAGEARADVTLRFDCAGEYVLVREDTAARAVVTLGRAVGDVVEEICAGQRAVYAALESLIGTRERFMYLTLYDPAYDLFMLSPLDRQRALPNLLGLASIDETSERYAREAKAHQSALAALGTPPARVENIPAQPPELGPRVANRWRDAVARVPQQAAAEPIPCAIEDLMPRQWPAREIVLAVRACGFWPTADELASAGVAGDLPALFAEWKRAEAAAARVAELTQRTQYSFNPACECCKRTRGVIAAELADAAAVTYSPTAREDLARAIVAELRAERARGPDNLPGKYAYAVAQANAEAAADAEWIAQAREIERIGAMRTAAERANAQRQQYEEAAPQLRAQFTRAQTAAKILKSEEFRTAAARERLSGVIERANALIAAAAGNFVIRIGPDLDFWIDECAFSAEITRGSGYQKFLAGVCCRLALSGFVIIDEGFGVVDPAHLPPLLNMLKSTRAFVLAHTEEIASGIDSPIRITKHTGGIIGAAPEPAAAPVPAFILEMIAPTTTGSTSAYECVCGSSIANTVANISSHNKTVKHRKFMEAQKK